MDHGQPSDRDHVETPFWALPKRLRSEHPVLFSVLLAHLPRSDVCFCVRAIYCRSGKSISLIPVSFAHLVSTRHLCLRVRDPMGAPRSLPPRTPRPLLRGHDPSLIRLFSAHFLSIYPRSMLLIFDRRSARPLSIPARLFSPVALSYAY